MSGKNQYISLLLISFINFTQFRYIYLIVLNTRREKIKNMKIQ